MEVFLVYTNLMLITQNRSTLFITSIITAVLSIYFASLWFPFAWDDWSQIVNSSLIRKIDFFLAFSAPTFDLGGGMLTGAFYRPAVTIANMVNYQLWGLNPSGFRLFQIILHAINAILVFFVCKMLIEKTENSTKRLILPYCISALFVVHPIFVESVVYIGSVGELLYTFFLLIASIIILRDHGRLRYSSVFWACTTLLLALLTKESAIIAVPIFIIYVYLYRKTDLRRVLFLGCILSSTIIIYTYLRFFVARLPIITEYGSNISNADLSERLLTIPYIVMHYVQTLFIPAQLVIYENTVVHNISDYRFWLYSIILVSIAITIFYIIHRAADKKIYLFFTAWFILGLFPLLNIYSLDMTVADRWMYFPSIGFFGLIAFLLYDRFLDASPWLKKLLFILFILYLGTLVIRTEFRIQDWASEKRLYSHDLQYVSGSYELESAYAKSLMDADNYEDAMNHIQIALYYNPNWEFAIINAGVIYQIKHNYAQAEYYYARAFALRENPVVISNLITLYLDKGQFDKAHKMIDSGLIMYPNYYRLNFLRALAYYKEGRAEEGLTELQLLIGKKIVPQDIAEVASLIKSYSTLNPLP